MIDVVKFNCKSLDREIVHHNLGNVSRTKTNHNMNHKECPNLTKLNQLFEQNWIQQKIYLQNS